MRLCTIHDTVIAVGTRGPPAVTGGRTEVRVEYETEDEEKLEVESGKQHLS